MTQTYENLGEKGLDVTFFYPVDINYALSKIHVEFVDVDDPTEKQVIETSMEPRRSAEKKYADILKQN
jgi:hypothetical protein